MRTVVLLSCLVVAFSACKKKTPDDAGKKAKTDMQASAMNDMGGPPVTPPVTPPVMTPPVMTPASMGAAATAPSAGKLLLDPNKTFSIPDPGDAWRCSMRAVPRQRSSLVKCKPKAPGKLFFMMVKGYDFPASSAKLNLESIFRNTYLKNYKKLFTGVKVLEQKPMKLFGQDAYTMTISAQHKRMGAITQTETAFAVGNRMYMITFSGDSARYKAMVGEALKWGKGFKLLTK